MKASFIKLRSRAFNKFKSVKPKRAVRKVAKKPVGPNKIKKTLRVVKHISIKPATVQKVSKPASPVGKTSPISKVGKEVMQSIIGHRRLFLRNRRLMNHVAHRPMIAAF